MYFFKWTLLLAAFWLLLSGFIQPLLLFFGVSSILLILFLLHRMDQVDQAKQVPSLDITMLRYVIWLGKEIFASSSHVAKLVWGPSKQLSPTLARIPVTSIAESQQVLYANSVTLTPGTLSVDLKDGELTVHALQKESIDELKQGAMEAKILGLWGARGT